MVFCRKVKVILKNTQGENSYFFEENPSSQFSASFKRRPLIASQIFRAPAEQCCCGSSVFL